MHSYLYKIPYKYSLLRTHPSVIHASFVSADNLACDFRSNYPAHPLIGTPDTTIPLLLIAFRTTLITTLITPEIRAAIHPYGRVSSRAEKKRGAVCDLRVALLIVVPAVCLVVVLNDFFYLQEYTACATAGDRLVA